MKGYTPRERLGLIMLALVVASLFLIERILDSSSCRRQEETQAVKTLPATDFQSDDSPETHWMRKSDRSEARHESDSIRDARKRASRDSSRYDSKPRKKKGNAKSSGNKGGNRPAPAPVRSLRDERL